MTVIELLNDYKARCFQGPGKEPYEGRMAINKACNSHDKLVAACEAVFEDLNKERDTYSEPRLIELCRAALAAAKEKEMNHE